MEKNIFNHTRNKEGTDEKWRAIRLKPERDQITTNTVLTPNKWHQSWDYVLKHKY